MQNADLIADRRRLKRSLSFWRVLAIIVFVAGVVGIIAAVGGQNADLRKPHVASIRFDEPIVDDQAKLELIREIGESDSAKAVLLIIDSPGGTVTGSEMLHKELSALNEKKPVVAVIRSMGTSGAYAIALASERIYAQKTSIVGSIGVIFQWAQVDSLLEKVGVEMHSVKSAPLKAEPSPFAPPPPAAEAMIERLIAGSLSWFTEILAEGRDLELAQARQLADGAVYTGQEALEIKLIDAIGNEEDALAWLQKNRNIDPSLELEDWTKEKNKGLEGFEIAAKVFSGLTGLSIQSERVQSSSGLLALWLPRWIE